MKHPKSDALTFIGDVFMPYPVSIVGQMPDSLVLNLEAPITRSKKGWPDKINLKTEINPICKVFGDRVVSACLANNHIMDFGIQGLTDTIDALRKTGTPHFGAGSLCGQCHKPFILEVAGCSVALLGYVCESTHGVFYTASQPGVIPLSLDRILEDIGCARAAGSRSVVVCLHWGIEEVSLPKPEDVFLAHAIIEGGADMIIGHHAHRLQPCEIYHGKYIFYNLGNAFFPDIDVPSSFNDAGCATSRYVKKQSYWNRRSIAVTLLPKEMRVIVTKLRSNNDTMYWGKPMEPVKMLNFTNGDSYLKIFNRVHRRCMIAALFQKWLASPKPLRREHLSFLLRILCRRTYLAN